MQGRTIEKLLIIVFLIFTVLSLSAADKDFEANVGFCHFEYRGNEDSNLAYGITIGFLEEVKQISEHQIDKSEIIYLLSENKKKEISQKIDSIEKLFTERDRLLFQYSDMEFESKLKLKDDEIKKAKEELAIIQEELDGIKDNVKSDAFSVIPVIVSSPEDGSLYTREPGAISETSEKYGLDIIVYGFIEDIDDYQYIEVRVWNNFKNKDVVIWNTAIRNDEISSLLKPGIDEVKTAIVGRDWAEISVDGPENSLIYIDGQFSGIGTINRILIDPGNREIEVKKNGSVPVKKSIYAEKNKHLEVSIELKPVEKKSVIIQTFPQHSDVYLDSEWQGESPIKLELEELPAAVRIKKRGFEVKSFFITDADIIKGVMDIDLYPSVNGRDDYIPDNRKRFYTSMGSFILSIPVTALFYSMVEQTSDAYNREYSSNGLLNYDELTRLKNLNVAQYNLYIGALGLNIFLFLDTIIQAVDYVGSVEHFSE